MEEEEAENMHGQQQSSLAAQMAAEEAEAEAMLKTKMFVFNFLLSKSSKTFPIV